MANPENNIQMLQELAQRLISQGNITQAAAVHEQILGLDSGCADSLNFLGMFAFQRGDTEKSVTLFRDAIDAGLPGTKGHRNLGLALQQLGRFPEALEVHRETIRKQPDEALPYLYAGATFQAMGQIDDARAAYSIALDLNPELRPMSTKEDTPVAMKEMARHAVQQANRGFSELFDQAVENMRQKHDPETLRGFEQMVAVQLRRQEPGYATELQQPFESYLPMKPTPWFEREEFEWVPTVEGAFDSLLEEFTGLHAENETTLKPYIHGDTGQEEWRDFFGSLRWSSLHLWAKGDKTPACERYPRTTGLMESIPLIYCDGRCPEVFFSIINPNTRLPPHFGQANYKLTAHLPIFVPEGCGIKVAGETRHWEPGKMLIFDDTFLHEAWNNSDQVRMVLIFDVWNPQVTPVEREAVQEVYRLVKGWLDIRRQRVLGE